MRLRDKVSIVTGGARGIGRAIAERFVEEGATVVLADRNGEVAEKAASELGERARAHQVDVTRKAEVEGLVRSVAESYGRLDVLVNNAAHARYDFAVDLAEEDWDYTLEISLKGYFLCSQAAAQQMLRQGGGKIVNISSISAAVGLARTAAYAASKGGIDALTRVMAVELARDNININAIAPGPVETEFSREVVSEEGFAQRRARIPMGRLGQPVDVAEAAVFLASPESDWVTGTVLRVDGGYTILGAMERREGSVDHR
jgi:NAD(P)-dependent dehydrogenase (short-subunit alcohol dehydrogenase family)